NTLFLTYGVTNRKNPLTQDKHSGGIAQKKAAATIVQRPFTSVCYEKFERMKLHSFGVVLIILF
ncbi:hypothetical protein, partial [Prevotella pectinovora]|uniref:hypothetical protein n=1 Tax=Prevotella pectinovora TaxID=1602169 RepID=UPI00307ADA04